MLGLLLSFIEDNVRFECGGEWTNFVPLPQFIISICPYHAQLWAKFFESSMIKYLNYI